MTRWEKEEKEKAEQKAEQKAEKAAEKAEQAAEKAAEQKQSVTPEKTDPITAFLAAHGFMRSQVQSIEPMEDCNMILTTQSKKVRIALDGE